MKSYYRLTVATDNRPDVPTERASTVEEISVVQQNDEQVVTAVTEDQLNAIDDAVPDEPVVSSVAGPVDEQMPAKLPYSHILKDATDVQRYMKLRVLPSTECALIVCKVQQCKSSRAYMFLSNDFTPTLVIKRKEHRTGLARDSTDIYYHTRLQKYFLRSPKLEHVTYPDYYREVIAIASIIVLLLTINLFQYYQVMSNKKFCDNPYEGDDEWVASDEEPAPESKTELFKDMAGRFFRQRADLTHCAVVRWGLYTPFGRDLEPYCKNLLLKGRPWREDTLEAVREQHNGYFEACLALGIVVEEQEATKFLEHAAAFRGFGTVELTNYIRRFMAQGWLNNPDIDALLETVAPGHRAAEEAYAERLVADVNERNAVYQLAKM